MPAAAHTQQQPSTPPLVFDGMTVVDVEHGKLIADQRLVIEGNRIRSVGSVAAVRIPQGAQVIDARGKYLMPGLWDMHAHVAGDTGHAFRSLIASGITGIREPGSNLPIAIQRQLRERILAGQVVGPPRQLISGPAVQGPEPGCERRLVGGNTTCVADSADAVRVVDSLKAAGADMIKAREVDRSLYFTLAAEARRIGIPLGGHVSWVTELEASDAGARIVDHLWGDAGCGYDIRSLGAKDLGGDASNPDVKFLLGIGVVKASFKGLADGDSTWEACHRQAAERFRRNDTWFVPSIGGAGAPADIHVSSSWRASNFPLLAGTDGMLSMPDELLGFVRNGLTPAQALRTATLNPAKMLHGTDSLGTVAAGKLADLVLLDADPLADISNVTQVRAVVANGRYFDRAALDSLVPKSDASRRIRP